MASLLALCISVGINVTDESQRGSVWASLPRSRRPFSWVTGLNDSSRSASSRYCISWQRSRPSTTTHIPDLISSLSCLCIHTLSALITRVSISLLSTFPSWTTTSSQLHKQPLQTVYLVTFSPRELLSHCIPVRSPMSWIRLMCDERVM